jgi:hypothetical protein
MDLTFVVQSKQGQKIDGILCAGTEDAFRMPTRVVIGMPSSMLFCVSVGNASWWDANAKLKE